MLTISTELSQLITPGQAWQYRIIPKEFSDTTITFYSDIELDQAHRDELELILDKIVLIEPARNFAFEQALHQYYRKEAESKNFTFSLGNNDFLFQLIEEAKELGSSDIHIESYEEKARIRFRIDGLLIEKYILEPEKYPSLINKIKIMSNLDISEKRRPQDGRIYFKENGNDFDIRVSVVPTLMGEKVVMRLLRADASYIDIQRLGLTESELRQYLVGVKKPHGIILISGPTGSGKTTTLYATLKLLNEVSRNITTIEDPIEYTLEGINQVQLKEDIGLTFASALRTFLRQDPDVIMVGEIRDAETASMAIRASLTGHLVLSTIHTNSAWGTIARLQDMKIPAYLIADTLNISVAQRLLRLLCPHCKKEESFDKEQAFEKYDKLKEIICQFTPQGCSKCHYTGYKGRRAIYEIIPIDQDLREMIRKERSANEVLLEKNIQTLEKNAISIFKQGLTSFDEIYSLLN